MPAARTSSRALACCLASASALIVACGPPRAGTQPPRPGDAAIRRAAPVTATVHASVSDVAAGSGGAIAVAGVYRGTLSLASDPAADDHDAGFVAVLEPSGAARWTAVVRGPGPAEVRAVAIAGDGRVAIAGMAPAGARLADRPLPPVFVAVLTPTGAPSWIAAIDATDHAAIADLAFAGDGELVAVGYGAGTISVTGTRVSSDGSHDALMMRFGAGGELRWLRRAGGSRADHAHAVAISGELIAVAGGFAGTADFGGATLRTNHHQDGFVAVLDAGGRLRWVNSFGGTARDSALAVAVAGDLVVVAGTFESADANFGTGPLDAEGVGAGFVAGFSARGEPRWSMRLGDRAGDAVTLAIAGDRVWIGGSFEHAQTIGGRAVDARGKRDALLVALDRGGAVHQVFGFGGDGHDDLTSVAADGDRVIAGGSFTGAARIGNFDLGGGKTAGFVIELAP